MLFNKSSFLILSVALLFSCQPSDSKIEKVTTIDHRPITALNPEVKQTSIPSAKPNNRFYNITAVLCGQTREANNLNCLFDTIARSSNAMFIDSSWKMLEKKRLLAMKTWGRKEFEKPNAKVKVVFYPFSGPDYLSANAFFPDADTYILLGLEPVGKSPDPSPFKTGEALDYANAFRKSLADIFDKSYFITQSMLADFQKQKVNGLLPVLCFFIQKTGNPITNIKYLVRHKQDSASEVDYDFKSGHKKPFGVHIFFTQDGKQRSAFYFKYDVSNKLFNDTTIFYKFTNANTQHCITYLKSASYLLHANFMSKMRRLILNNSDAVIKDDTGIPFDYFEKENNFDIKLYGHYTKPVSNFPYLKMQKTLLEALRRDSITIRDLPFHLGYHWGTKKDIIIFAQKKTLLNYF